LLLAVVSTGLTVALAYGFPFRTQIATFSTASAYAALALLVVSLSLGPLNVLSSRPNPVSTDLRRDIGIWAALLGLFHTVLGLQVHMDGNFWLYFSFPPGQSRFPLRYDPFGLANYAGLIAAGVLVMLFTLSNDAALRALGPKRWKALQRWNYAGFGLVAAHGALYQILEKRNAALVGLLGLMIFIGAALQLAGCAATRARERRRVSTGRGAGAK
jgi:sulfoxide reductase heme-binding subunit YedZ